MCKIKSQLLNLDFKFILDLSRVISHPNSITPIGLRLLFRPWLKLFPVSGLLHLSSLFCLSKLFISRKLRSNPSSKKSSQIPPVKIYLSCFQSPSALCNFLITCFVVFLISDIFTHVCALQEYGVQGSHHIHCTPEHPAPCSAHLFSDCSKSLFNLLNAKVRRDSERPFISL